MKEEYLSRIKTVDRQLEQDQIIVESLILSDNVLRAFEKFRAAWEKYLEESSATLSAAAKNYNREDLEQLSDESRKLFEKAYQSLEALIEVNKNAPDSWTAFGKIVYKENRLAFLFLFIWGVALFFVLISFIYRRKASKN